MAARDPDAPSFDRRFVVDRDGWVYSLPTDETRSVPELEDAGFTVLRGSAPLQFWNGAAFVPPGELQPGSSDPSSPKFLVKDAAEKASHLTAAAAGMEWDAKQVALVVEQVFEELGIGDVPSDDALEFM